MTGVLEFVGSSLMSSLNPIAAADAAGLPVGVRVMPLKSHPDQRGQLTEIFRNEWHRSPPPMRWVAYRSAANVLRGVHVHVRHWSYLCVVQGETLIGIHDLRPEERTARRSLTICLSESRLQMLVIPPGVAHGLYSPIGSTALLASSGHDDPSDHLRCRWDSADLGLEWPCTAPELSALDRDAAGYTELRGALVRATARQRDARGQDPNAVGA
jgi:dTDP-4-dehydrorhamnose 3,5-epimerase